MSTVTHCRSCGAPIRFARTDAGKFMPLDAAPNPDGNVEVVHGKAVVYSQTPLVPTEMWMPHWKTCNSPDQHRKP